MKFVRCDKCREADVFCVDDEFMNKEQNKGSFTENGYYQYQVSCQECQKFHEKYGFYYYSEKRRNEFKPIPQAVKDLSKLELQ